MSKKIVCALLSAIFIITFSNCSPSENRTNTPKAESGTIPILTVLIDNANYKDEDIEKLLEDIPGYGENFVANITFVPNDSQPEIRDGAIQNARLDLVSGGGADVYLCACTEGIYHRDMSKGTFTYPQSLMKENCFLPLDQYIDTVQFMDWDTMFPVIMETGKSKEGQVIIPLTFAVYASLFDSSKYSQSSSLPMTIEEQLKSDDLGLKIAGRGTPFAFSTRLGCLIDYSSDALTFSEDELLQYAEAVLAVDAEGVFTQGETIGFRAPDELIGPTSSDVFPDKLSGGKSKDFIMLPAYNRTGGVTAYITSFGAVNRNTEYPAYAFSILDRLAGKDILQDLSYYGRSGMPIYMDLGTKKSRLGESRWALTDWNYQQYISLCEKINQVEFYTEANLVINQMLYDCFDEADSEKRKNIVSKAYSEMKMIAGEI